MNRVARCRASIYVSPERLQQTLLEWDLVGPGEKRRGSSRCVISTALDDDHPSGYLRPCYRLEKRSA
jgi:hypothetical protein